MSSKPSSRPIIIEIKLTDLTIGHFVVKIAKQEGNFSLNASGHIKNQKVIEHLKNKKVISVFIDESKTLITNQEKKTNPKKSSSSIKTKAEPKKDRAKITAELKQAKEIFNKSKVIQKELFTNALSGASINLTPVIDITNKSIDAIFNSPDSLACMVNIRAKDEYLLEHSVAVSVYIIIFAHFLKMDRKIVQELSIGAFLHDIGKIKIPDAILNKPGKLTDAEFAIMKTHANHSIDIIQKTPNISVLSLQVAALHHEKINGNGYPFQIQGDDISKYGRMIAICDIFDALTANRVYKEGFPHTKAFTILLELVNQNHLDKTLVNQFIKCMGVFPIGSMVQLHSKKLAIVEQRNENDPTNPLVRSFYSVDLHEYLDTHDIDLNSTDDYIEKSVRAEEFDLDMNTILEMLLMEG